MLRKVLERKISTEELREIRAEIKEDYIQAFNEIDDGVQQDREELKEYLDKNLRVAYTRRQEERTEIALLGIIVYQFTGIAFISLYASFFLIETLYRNHLTDLVSYSNINRSDSDEEALFKTKWNRGIFHDVIGIYSLIIVFITKKYWTSKYSEAKFRLLKRVLEKG